jgi:hypothetical protein
VGLDVDVLGVPDGFRSLDGESFDLVDVLAARVVPLAG